MKHSNQNYLMAYFQILSVTYNIVYIGYMHNDDSNFPIQPICLSSYSIYLYSDPIRYYHVCKISVVIMFTVVHTHEHSVWMPFRFSTMRNMQSKLLWTHVALSPSVYPRSHLFS